MCISFSYNSSKKAKSYLLMTWLLVFSFHLYRHAPCFDAELEIHRGGSFGLMIWKNDQFYTNSALVVIRNYKTENILFRINSSVNNWFFKTRLTFAVTLNVKKITSTMSIFHIISKVQGHTLYYSSWNYEYYW